MGKEKVAQEAPMEAKTLSSIYTPILRWAGSKKRSLPDIQPFLPAKIERYLEAFAGSACLFFHIAPEKAIISDNNRELIRFYRTVAAKPSIVYRRFASISRNAKTYYSIRSKWASERDTITRAAHFFYLNRNCFNGLYRTNSKGLFNVPFASARVPAYPTEQTVIVAAELLQRARILCSDFETLCLSKIRKNDFVYLDPPYYVPAKRVFREYSSNPFSNDDFQRLERTLRNIDHSGARFLLSYPDCELASKLSRSWNRSRISVRRTIASDTLSRGRTRELMIYNYDLAHA